MSDEAAEPAAKAHSLSAKSPSQSPVIGHPPAHAEPIIGYPAGQRTEPAIGSSARAEPEPAKAPPPPAPGVPAPPHASAPIPSAEVVPLEELDFGESPFTAPPRRAEPAPEAEPAELPMLESEEDIELTAAGEPTPTVAAASARLGFPAAPPAERTVEASLASGKPAVPAGEWTVARAPEFVPPKAARPPDATAAPVPSDGGEAQLREALSRASREVIERIAWEVVPQLAETIIREQIDRLAKERRR